VSRDVLDKFWDNAEKKYSEVTIDTLYRDLHEQMNFDCREYPF